MGDVTFLWYVPAAVLLVLLVPLVVAITRTTSEARHLLHEVGRFGELRPALVRVRDEVAEFRSSLEALRRR